MPKRRTAKTRGQSLTPKKSKYFLHANGSVSFGGRFVSKDSIPAKQRLILTNNAKYKGLTKRKIVAKSTKKAKGKAKSKPKSRKKPTTKGKSLGQIIRNRFSGRKFANTAINAYPDIAGTIHKTYQADPNRLGKFLSQKRFKGKVANLILTYVDVNGEIKHRSTQNTGVEDTELLTQLFDTMLNKYQAMGDIQQVDDVEVDVWDTVDGWGDDTL